MCWDGKDVRCNCSRWGDLSYGTGNTWGGGRQYRAGRDHIGVGLGSRWKPCWKGPW